jgi:hypothetical protein
VFAVPSVRKPVPDTPAAVVLWPDTAWPIGGVSALVWAQADDASRAHASVERNVFMMISFRSDNRSKRG